MKHIVSMLTRDEYIILPVPAPDTADSRIPPRSTFPADKLHPNHQRIR